MNSSSYLTSTKRKYHILPILFVVFVSFIIASFYLEPLHFAIVIGCGILLLSILRLKPEIIMMCIVILGSSIVFEEALPGIETGIGYFHVLDVLLLSLFGLIPLKYILEKEFRLVRTPLDLPLLLFYLAALIAACLAIFYYDLSLTKTLRKLSIVTYYLIFLAVTNLIHNEKQIRFLVKGLFCIGIVVGIAMLVQAIVGESVQLMPGRVEKAATLNVIYEATRVLPPGQTLIYVLFITSACLIALQENNSGSSWRYVLMLCTGIGVTLTYNRSYWVSCIFCLILIMFLVDSAARKRFMRMSLIWFLVIGLSLIPILLSDPGGGGRQSINALTDRFDSLFKGRDTYADASLEWRRIENRYALERIAKDPLIGIGLNNDYRPRVFGPDENLTSYIHNAYLYIVLNFGIMGALPFFVFYFGFILRGLRRWKKIQDNYLKSLVLGFSVSGIGIILACMVDPIFMQWFSIIVISIMTGLNEVIIGSKGKILEEMSIDEKAKRPIG